ncbi:hypothetical protein J6590_100305, partial [Homalodisca vitripennis]
MQILNVLNALSGNAQPITLKKRRHVALWLRQPNLDRKLNIPNNRAKSEYLSEITKAPSPHPVDICIPTADL